MKMYKSRYCTACLLTDRIRFTRTSAGGGGEMIEGMREVLVDSPEWSQKVSFGWGEASYEMTPAEIASACSEGQGNAEAYNRLFEAEDFEALTHIPYWGGINLVASAPKRTEIVARFSQAWA